MLLFPTTEPDGGVLTALADALDLIDVGLLLLNPAMCPRFINRTFIDTWDLPPALLAPGATFHRLFKHIGSSSQGDPQPELIATWLRDRATATRDAPAIPTYIDHIDGRRLQLRCRVPPGGWLLVTCVDVTPLKQEHELQLQARDDAERLGVDLRFSNECLEDQAAHLATLAEAADELARSADLARRQLEVEMAEKLVLEAQLRRMATIDALTGALNRGQVMTLGQHEFDRFRSTGQGVAVLMLDIDHFKTINDQYGHAAGDAALQELVVRLRAGVRQIDLVGRLGGEEFVVILPGVLPVAALHVAERLRGAIAVAPVSAGLNVIPMTVSIGVAMVDAEDLAFEQTLARADGALYVAKREGRDCVRCSEPRQPQILLSAAAGVM